MLITKYFLDYVPCFSFTFIYEAIYEAVPSY